MAETPFSPEPGVQGDGTTPSAEPQEAAANTPSLTPEPPTPSESAAESAPIDATAAPAGPVSQTAPSGAEASPVPTPAAPEPSTDAAPPAPAAEAPAEPPGVAATIAVPPLEEGAAGEGGEWELLVERFNTWWNSGEFGRQWQRIRGPLKGVAILVAVVLALRVYATVVATIDAIPLVSGLLELTGLIAVLQFCFTRLLRSSDRQEVLAQWERRWLDFRGRN